MNIVVIPFHDWRKNINEGFRTRDAHIIESLQSNSSVSKLIIVNRPTTLLELFAKKNNKNIKGEVLIKKAGFKLLKINDKIYVIDYISTRILSQIINKYLWFIHNYQKDSYVSFIDKCLVYLKIDNYNVLCQNIFSALLLQKLKPRYAIFDAWDNFLKFPVYSKITSQLSLNYKILKTHTDYWLTNSDENISFFKEKYQIKNIELLKNGVSFKMFLNNDYRSLPEDLTNIQRPIIGFGGKISYLLDTDLINYVILKNPNFSFVFIGQILDTTTFLKIKKSHNVYFLGDKHYNIYPNYIKNFDTCIVPYVINEKQHGGDSLKAYEYLAAGKKVVGTRGNGLEYLEDYVYVADTHESFSNEIKNYHTNFKKKLDFNNYSWDNKTEKIIKMFCNEKND